MKSYLKLLTAACAACFLNVTAFAADTAPAVSTATATASSPTGTWKWTQAGRNGGQGFEQTLKLDYTGDKLTGTMVGMQGPQGQIPDVAISDASFKEGTVAFSITREFGGNKITSQCEGKLDSDTIKGSSTRPGRDGGAPMKRDWVATRSK